MSAFTPAEVSYLQSGRLGRLATIGRDGRPHVVPVGYVFDGDAETVDIHGYLMTFSKKWRDVAGNDRVAFVVDDSAGPGRPRGVEIRGRAEQVPTGDRPEEGRDGFIRIHPTRIVSWGIDTSPYKPHSRPVAQ